METPQGNNPHPNPSFGLDLENLEELMETEQETVSTTYESPLLKKARQLDVELLREEIPHFQEGKLAKQILDDPNQQLTVEQKEQCTQLYNRGQRAKENLYLAALPLIKLIAGKEWKRRQQWASQISYEDLVQEATVGFLKGLEAFKVESLEKSSTNYLGQWMLVEMQRSAESMDYDLNVSKDAARRFRRIRALRGRLIQDLGREPTDEEIAEASRNPEYITRPTMVGKAKKEGEVHAVGRGVTVRHVEMERESRSRIDPAMRFTTQDGDKETRPAPGTIDPERTQDSGLMSTDPAELVADNTTHTVISTLVQKVIKDMGLPPEQKTVISLRYGLPPYTKEYSVKEISTATKISRARVSKIVNAFASEMTKKGGFFHYHLHHGGVEETHKHELDWIIEALGGWKPEYETKKRDIPKILTSTKTTAEQYTLEVVTATTRTNLNSQATGVQVWYECEYHKRIFSLLYPNQDGVHNTTTCPSCDNTAHIVRQKTFNV